MINLELTDEIKKLKKEREFFVITDFTVIRIMAHALEVFVGKQGVLSAEMISQRLEIPIDLCMMILEHLVGESMLLSVTEPEAGYVLAGDAKNITLGDISKAAQNTGFAEKNDNLPDALKLLMDKRIENLSKHSLAEIVNTEE